METKTVHIHHALTKLHAAYLRRNRDEIVPQGQPGYRTAWVNPLAQQATLDQFTAKSSPLKKQSHFAGQSIKKKFASLFSQHLKKEFHPYDFHLIPSLV